MSLQAKIRFMYFPSSSPKRPDETTEEELSEESAYIPSPVKPWKELECLDLFRKGRINEKSLQVLVRLSELVKAQ